MLTALQVLESYRPRYAKVAELAGLSGGFGAAGELTVVERVEGIGMTDYYGVPVKEAEAWSAIISCLSANNEAFAHAVCDWGAKQIGHENTGNSPTLARRLLRLGGAWRSGSRMERPALSARYQERLLGSLRLRQRQDLLGRCPRWRLVWRQGWSATLWLPV